MPDDDRDMLRHALATLAYRARKVLSDAPPGFARFKAAPGTRRPARILAHMGDLMDWGLHMADGEQVWHDSQPMDWSDEVVRFYAAVQALDTRLASQASLGVSAEGIFQGPLADSLWHLGQLALLRGMADAPIRGENYFAADIVRGRVGPDQTPPRREF